jgi:hypothetical protein
VTDVRAKVLDWLEVTGFPLEMKAASAFRDAGFEVRQSTTYADPLSEKGREIDVLASDPDLFGFVDLAAVIECKSSPNPWVILTANDVMEGYNRLRTRAVFTERAYLTLSRGRLDDLEIEPWLHRKGRCGYALRQAFSKGNDPGYDAAMSVLSACKAIFPPTSLAGWKVAAAALPIIVVNAPLLECELQADGGLLLSEVKYSHFLFSARLPDQVSCCIRVVNASHLDETAHWAKGVMNHLRKDLEPAEKEIIEELKKTPGKRSAK